jgi:hypothetical protein
MKPLGGECCSGGGIYHAESCEVRGNQRLFSQEMHRRLAWGLVVALFVGATPAVAAEVEPPTPLQRLVDRLGVEAQYFDRSAIVGISVERLDSGETAAFQGDRWLKAASSLKATWLAAAVIAVGLDAIAPFAAGVFRQSSNEVGGRVIGLAGGLDAINSFTSGLGMNQTLVVEWTFGGEHRSSIYPGPHPSLNFTTTDDLVTFWRLMSEGQILGRAASDTLLEWGRMERLGGYSSGLLTRLPSGAAEYTSFKMGWLPPGRTEEDDETGEIVPVDALDSIIGSGIVAIPNGPTYAVAIGLFGGTEWPAKVAFVAYASCRIHEEISGENRECDRPGDPGRTRSDTDPPIGELTAAAGNESFVGVRGWAVDADDARGEIVVRFSVDGHRTGAVRANRSVPQAADPFLVGPGHGFERVLLVELAPGPHEICGIAINDGAGPDTPIGCQSLIVR